MNLRVIAIAVSGILIGLFLGFYLLKFTPNFQYQSIEDTKPKQKIVLGFQPYWLISKADKNYSDYLTDYTYFGLGINADGSIKKLETETAEEPGWTNLKNDKFKKLADSNIKYSLLIHTSDKEVIAQLINNHEQSAQTLINEVTPIMQKYGFTDLNIDIESFTVYEDSERQKFTAFISEIKKGLTKNNLGTLTIDVSPTAMIKKILINVEEIQPQVDYIVFMTYDFHYSGSYVTGPVAPINGTGITRDFDIEESIKQAIRIVPKEKIILGIPLYGYEWETLSDQLNSAIIPGTSATASNRRAEELLASCINCKKGYGEYSQQPYIIYPSEDGKYFNQIFYEDEISLRKKLELTKKYDIAGIALWAIGYEGNEILKPIKDFQQF